jgi:hypothetical protein
MQETYILPEDKEIIQEKFIDYTISKIIYGLKNQQMQN